MTKTLKEYQRYCPSCGNGLLEKNTLHRGSCGSIIDYQCSNCGKLWREDQSGIVSREINLTEIHSTEEFQQLAAPETTG